jgi:hypothetical protein
LNLLCGEAEPIDAPAYYPTPSEIIRAARATAERECRRCGEYVPDAAWRAVLELSGYRVNGRVRVDAGLRTCARCLHEQRKAERWADRSSPRTTSAALALPSTARAQGGLGVSARPDMQWVAGPEPRTDTGAAPRDQPAARGSLHPARRPPSLPRRREPTPQRTTGRQAVAQCTLGERGYAGSLVPNSACYLEGQNGMRDHRFPVMPNLRGQSRPPRARTPGAMAGVRAGTRPATPLETTTEDPGRLGMGPTPNPRSPARQDLRYLRPPSASAIRCGGTDRLRVHHEPAIEPRAQMRDAPQTCPR